MGRNALGSICHREYTRRIKSLPFKYTDMGIFCQFFTEKIGILYLTLGNSDIFVDFSNDSVAHKDHVHSYCGKLLFTIFPEEGV